jgi:NADH-quinone oxidoreductase subunit M
MVGAWRVNPWWTLASGIGIVVGVAYIWRALQKAFFSDTLPTAHELESEQEHKFSPITWPEIAGVALLGLSTLAVGLYPQILLDQIEPAVKALLTGGMQ